MTSDCEPGSGEVRQPVSKNGVLNAINISEPVDVPTSSASPVSSTSSSALSNGAPVQVYNHASPTTPMEVDGPPGLTSPIECAPGANESSATSSDDPLVPLVKPIHTVDLDSVDFSKVPAWLGPPLMQLQKDFRGDLEDKILGCYVALEMAWQPVSAPLFYYHLII